MQIQYPHWDIGSLLELLRLDVNNLDVQQAIVRRQDQAFIYHQTVDSNLAPDISMFCKNYYHGIRLDDKRCSRLSDEEYGIWHEAEQCWSYVLVQHSQQHDWVLVAARGGFKTGFSQGHDVTFRTTGRAYVVTNSK